MNIAIIGSGYVGLVTGSCLAYMGNKVTCLDVDKDKIEKLNNGVVPVFEPGLKKNISHSVKNSCLTFSTNISETIKNADIIFITVGTPIGDDGSSDLSYIYSASKSIGKYINSYKIIITKSTIPVGTTFDIKNKIEEDIKLRNVDIKFDICNNPEFLKQGKAVSDFMSPDRIIVGIENDKIKPVLEKIYKPFSINCKKLIFMDIPSSELTKYAANAMLATKISFINEMSNIAEKVGADINQVRSGIGSDSRIGYDFIYPSVGYGGSCFPKDVRSVINFAKKKGYAANILESVDLVNNNQKKYFFDKLFNRFKTSEDDFKNKKFGIWGLSFKPGTDDMRESASIYFVENIIRLGGLVSVYDPKAMNNAKFKYFQNLKNITYCNDKMDVADGSSALILLSEWPEFRALDFKKLIIKLKSPVLFDGKNQFDKYDMKANGIEYHQIGVKAL
jgi:UDPglucose 6-dehydrogenase